MRTVDNYLTYGFTDAEKLKLEMLGVVNGCGAKGGFNFSNFVDKIERYAGFESEKFDNLKMDIRELCSYQHDVRFWEGGNFFDFWIANIEFTSGILGLLHWTSVRRRLAVSIVLLGGLLAFGRSAFSFGTKRCIREFINAN